MRVYTLDQSGLSEEQIAVVFAMTSRNPEPFDRIAAAVSREQAASFHERWVTGYGHASVAEHAVSHIAVEGLSRLAADQLESGRLASYTEKSTRYQIIDQDDFHIPEEIADAGSLRNEYRETCRGLFRTYRRMLKLCQERLRELRPRAPGETEPAYRLRLRREATDGCRAALPAATLTNVGMTANARTLEHTVTRLMSSPLAETRQLGERIREQGRRTIPTLIKYAGPDPWLEQDYRRRCRNEDEDNKVVASGKGAAEPQAYLLGYDPDAERKIAAALQYSAGRAGDWLETGDVAAQRILDEALSGLPEHTPPPRELELAVYWFEFVMDYGACREFRRHRMQTCLPAPLTVDEGWYVPETLRETRLEAELAQAAGVSAQLYRSLRREAPATAPYAVLHAQHQRLRSQANLREFYHIFRLRASREAHESIRKPVRQAMELIRERHPRLLDYLRLKEEPA